MQQQRPQTLQDLQLAGRAALQAGDTASAIAAFQQATTLAPASPVAWHGLALARAQASDPHGAIAAADRCLKLDPRSLRTLLLRADLTVGLGHTAQAASFYLQAVRAADGQSVPPDLERDLRRADAAFQHLSQELAARLRDSLHGSGAYAPQDARRLDQAVDILAGRGRVWHQEPRYLHVPGLAAVPFHDRAAFAWLADLEARTDAIEAELRQVMADEAAFSAYVKSDPNRPGSTQKGLADNSDWSACFLIRNGRQQDAVADLCPVTLETVTGCGLSELPSRAPSVLFSRLEPGMHIPAHTGMINTRLIVHLPLIVPEGCAFRVGPETRTWRRGEAWVFDDTIEHEAWNRSAQARVILLFEVWNPAITPAERVMLQDMFQALDASGGPSEAWQI